MRIFLSYQNSDHQEAQFLSERLLRSRPNIDVFFAPRILAAGAYWLPRLAEELAKADVLLFLVGRRIGPWQELEYYEARRLSALPERKNRPLILPVVTVDQAPGLPFFALLHQIFAPDPTSTETVTAVLDALDGAVSGDSELAWRRFNPYKGLPALTTSDAAFFFGREQLTGLILERLQKNSRRVQALVGGSGVGKSSLAQAGVLAALKSQLWPGQTEGGWPDDLAASRTWLSFGFRPGEAPLKELALGFVRLFRDKTFEQDEETEGWARRWRAGATLAGLIHAAKREIASRTGDSPPARFIIYLDQGEELYARAPVEDARRFSALLAEAAGRPDCNVLASFRADYYGHLQADSALFPVTDRIDVPPLDPAVLNEIIQRPALQLGARFDSVDLPRQIAAATSREAGALPLLSYLLSDMWTAMQAKGDGVLRWLERIELLDVAAPLRERAERYRRQFAENDAALRRLFTLRLAHVPRVGDPVRRRAPRNQCTAEEWRIAEKLADAEWRLLAITEEGGDAEPVAEVAHEQLLRRWPTLTRWLEERRGFLIWKGEIEASRREWERTPSERKDHALLMGLNLDRAREWYRAETEDISIDDRRFIEASILRREAERRRERNRQRLTAGAAAVAGIFAIVTLGLAIVANRALDNSLINQSRQLVRFANVINSRDSRSTYAALLALAALPDTDARRPYVAAAEQALYDSLYNRTEIAVLHSSEDEASDSKIEVNSVAFSPDGKRLVTASAEEAVLVWDVATATQLAKLKGAGSAAVAVKYSLDGSLIAAAYEGGAVKLWDAHTFEQSALIDVKEIIGANAPTDADHAQDANTANQAGRSNENVKFKIRRFDLSPDHRFVVVGTTGPQLWIFDSTNGTLAAKLQGHSSEIWGVAFDREGRRLASGSADGSARIWDLIEKKQVAAYQGLGVVRSVAFSPDGSLLAAASEDQIARIWDLRSDAPPLLLKGHRNKVNNITFSSDGSRVLTASWDRTARSWAVATGKQQRVFWEHTDTVASAAFSEDGSKVATASWDGTARLWTTKLGPIDLSREDAFFLDDYQDLDIAAAYDRSGERVVVSASAGTSVLNAKTGEEIRKLPIDLSEIGGAEFGPKGRLLTFSRSQPGAILWDTETGQKDILQLPPDALSDDPSTLVSAAFSSDGAHLVLLSEAGVARLFDVGSGHYVLTLRGHEQRIVYMSFSPDGTRIVTGSTDDSARTWDVKTGNQLAVLKGHGKPVLSANFSPDGLRIVTASEDGTARVWDSWTGQQLREFSGHGGTVSYAEFSSDGTRVLSTSGETVYGKYASVRIWDSASGQEYMAVKLPFSGLRASFSPDELHVLAVTDHGDICIVDLKRAAVVAVLRGQGTDPGGYRNAYFSLDGVRVIGIGPSSIAIWRIFQSTEDLIQHSKRVLPRCMAQDELMEAFLETEPPQWCIDMGKWPYDTPRWKEYLSQTRAGRAATLPRAEASHDN